MPTEDPDAVKCFVSELEINLKIARSHQPSEKKHIDFFNCLDVCHKSPDSSERQCKSRT